MCHTLHYEQMLWVPAGCMIEKYRSTKVVDILVLAWPSQLVSTMPMTVLPLEPHRPVTDQGFCHSVFQHIVHKQVLLKGVNVLYGGHSF